MNFALIESQEIKNPKNINKSLMFYLFSFSGIKENTKEQIFMHPRQLLKCVSMWHKFSTEYVKAIILIFNSISPEISTYAI